MEQKIALVTGANKGIGYEVAAQLAARNFRVFVGARNEKAGREAAIEIGNDAAFLKIDVADEKGIHAAAAETPALFETTLRTNTLGPLFVARAFKSLLQKSKAPRIVNVSSGSGQLTDGADGWAPAYSISKTALNGVTVQLAAALPDFAINSVCPGWVRTDMGGSKATRSVEQGAAGIVWLAADAPQNLTGKFLRDRKVIPW